MDLPWCQAEAYWVLVSDSKAGIPVDSALLCRLNYNPYTN